MGLKGCALRVMTRALSVVELCYICLAYFAYMSPIIPKYKYVLVGRTRLAKAEVSDWLLGSSICQCGGANKFEL